MKTGIKIRMAFLATLLSLPLFSQPNWVPADSVISNYIKLSKTFATNSDSTSSILQPGDWFGVFTKFSDSLEICNAAMEISDPYKEIPVHNNSKSNNIFIYKIWKKDQNCIIDSIIAITQLKDSLSDTLLLTRLLTFPIVVNYPVLEVCNNDNITLTPTISRNKSFVSFSSTSIVIDSSLGNIDPSSYSKMNGKYNISVTSEYCLSKNNFTFTVNPPPVYNFQKQFDICPGNYITIDLSNSKSVNSWNWKDDTKSPLRKIENIGKYYIEGMSSNGCKSVDSIQIDALPVPTFGIEKQRYLCPNHTILLTPTNQSEYNWKWSDGTTTAENIVGALGTYAIEATNNLGCKKTDTVVVSEKSISIDKFVSNVINADCDKPGKIEISTLNLKNGQTPFIQSAKNDLTGIESKLDELQEGFYKINIQDADGCITSWQQLIKVNKNCLNDFPVFSPNIGKNNENYFISSEGIAKIYNRDGKLVCTLKVPAYWDGNDNTGQPVPMGTYLIVIGNEKPINVTIIR